MHPSDTALEPTALRPISVLICALGGEGGGVLSEWLTDIARRAGYPAQSTSVPGVAQRTGATTYFFEMLPVPLDSLGGRRPVFSLNPLPGTLDVVVSSELLETARCASNGLPSPDRTHIITSSSRTLTNAERTTLGDGRLDDAALLALVQASCKTHQVLDMARLASEHGTVVSAVMLGALAASGALPFGKELYLQVIRDSGRGAAASCAGFEAAWEQVLAGRAQIEAAMQQLRAALGVTQAPWLTEFPAPAREMIALGWQRVCEYQDARYGALYLARLRAVAEAELAACALPHAAGAVTRDTARWLALWMSFDDIVRVADLKSRAARFARVRSEVRADDGDLVRVFDHVKPGVPEFAALLPASLARRLLGWEQRRVRAGRTPWVLPLKLASHSVTGMLALRLLARLKVLRRIGSRYQQEQALIEEWLSAVRGGLAEDLTLGHELAQCGRLIKGYGSTNERARDNLLHVIRHLCQPAVGTAQARAAAVRRAREAALTDEAGQALDRTLVEAGAPPRPLKAQPIRFMPRRPPLTGQAR